MFVHKQPSSIYINIVSIIQSFRENIVPAKVKIIFSDLIRIFFGFHFQEVGMAIVQAYSLSLEEEYCFVFEKLFGNVWATEKFG